MKKKRLFDSNGLVNNNGLALEHQFKSLVKIFIKKNWKKYEELDLETLCNLSIKHLCFLNDSEARKKLKKIWNNVEKKVNNERN